MLNLGLRKVKHVQFVHNDNPKEALEGSLLNRLLSIFHPAGILLRRLDELRVVLCLYELVILPLRLAFGTGYGILKGPRYSHLHHIGEEIKSISICVAGSTLTNVP